MCFREFGIFEIANDQIVWRAQIRMTKVDPIIFRRAQSGDLVRVLLENFLYHHSEELDECGGGGGSAGTGRRKSYSEGLVVSLWTSLQKSLAFGPEEDEEWGDKFPAQTLSSLSLALLLALVYYPSYEQRANAYKQMLSIFQNAQGWIEEL